MTERPLTSANVSLRASINVDSWYWRVALLAGYFLIGVVFTWPLLPSLSVGVIQKGARPIDTGQGIWNLWWMEQAVLHGQNPYFTRYVFFPETVNLFWQTLSLPNTFLVLPVTLVLGPIAAFNILELLSFALGGYAAYCLVRTITARRFAAIVAGFVYACSPYHMQAIYGGALESIAIQWIPIYILLLIKALRRPDVLHILLAGACLILVTMASYYYGIYCAIYTALHILVFLFAQNTWRSRRRLVLVGAWIAIIWIAAFLPFVWMGGAIGAVAPGDWRSRQIYHSVALVDLISPNNLHPLWGSAATNWLAALHPFGLESGASLGIIVSFLVAIGAVAYYKQAWPWIVLALLTLLLSLGPELKVTEQSTGIPLPFKLLDALGVLKNASRPAYFVTIWMIPISILVSYGIARIQSFSGPKRYYGVATVTLLLLSDLLVRPWPIMTLRVDDIYAALNNDVERGAVLELPPDSDHSEYMLNQICHGRPLAGGYLARTPFYPLAEYHSAVQQLWNASDPAPDVVAIDTARQLSTLGIHVVALNLDRLPTRQVDRIRQQLRVPGIQLSAQDAHVELYAVDMSLAGAMLVPSDGWFAAETNRGRTWRWMGNQAAFRLYTRTDTIVTLSFTATAYQSARPLTIQFDHGSAGTYAIPGAPTDRRINLSLFVPAGEHNLIFGSPAAPAPDGRQLSLSISQVQLRSAPPASISGRTLPFEPALRMPIPNPPCLVPFQRGG